MKHIEVSKKITLTRDVNPEMLKETLIERLEKALEIETLSGDVSRLRVTGTTGSPSGIARHSYLDINVTMAFENGTARIIVDGFARPARSLTFLYLILFFFLLLVGLLPGFIETNADKSSAIDALFFLILGVYLIMDVNKKLDEPREILEAALESLNTTFG